MKFFLGTSALVFMVILLSVQGGLTSCTKDRTIYDTVTVTKTDTLIVKDTVTITDTTLTAEILTANHWKYDSLRGVYGGEVKFYVRGGPDNTENFDSDDIVFYANGTGFSIDAVGGTHEITEWQFVNDAHTRMTFKYFVTSSPIYHLITWDNIRYKNKNIMYDEYYHDNYVNKEYHGQAVRSPK